MVTFDCPCCAAPVEFADRMAPVDEPVVARCPACALELELAPDPVADRSAAA